MNKDKAYWDNYNRYLGQLTLLNRVKSQNLLNDQEYIRYKKELIREYKIQDFI